MEKPYANTLAGMAKSYIDLARYYDLASKAARPYNFLTSTARPFDHSGHGGYYKNDNGRGGHDDDGAL